jgi:hypothetical protein
MKLTLFLLFAAQTPDPMILLREASVAWRQMLARSTAWTSTETTTITRRAPDAAVLSQSSFTYDNIFVVDGMWPKLTARNDQPLSSGEAAEQDKKMREVEVYRRKTPIEKRKSKKEARRASFRFESVLEGHTGQLLREDTFRGRAVWMCEYTPRPDRKPSNDLEEEARTALLRVAIDKETKLPIFREWKQLFVRRKLPAGTTTTFRLLAVDHSLWLPELILTVVPRADGAIDETRQTFSRWRRFSSETRVLVEADTPQN